MHPNERDVSFLTTLRIFDLSLVLLHSFSSFLFSTFRTSSFLCSHPPSALYLIVSYTQISNIILFIDKGVCKIAV
ncbi:hypothetical protein BDR06DRAFT_682904 [Suillus hirtellus]|nr:hypothetical protein BDR06DRAFT_682904 [Suillus hirtellus]